MNSIRNELEGLGVLNTKTFSLSPHASTAQYIIALYFNKKSLKCLKYTF